jgi:hypothetical protein
MRQNMLKHLMSNALENVRHWARDESGNATFEWALVVGGAVGMSMAVMATIGSGSQAFAQTAEAELSAMEIRTQ